jgi:hypothetical protein
MDKLLLLRFAHLVGLEAVRRIFPKVWFNEGDYGSRPGSAWLLLRA